MAALPSRVGDPSPFDGTLPVASISSQEDVTLLESQTFCISTRSGDVLPGHVHGLFVLDRRMLSQWELRLNGQPTESLAVEHDVAYAGAFVVRGHPRVGHADADLVVFRRRHVGWGMREVLEVANHGLEERAVELEVRVGADFADIFAVKEQRVVQPPAPRTPTDAGMRFDDPSAEGRSVVVRFSVPPEIEGEVARWQLLLAPEATWTLCCEVGIVVAAAPVSPLFVCGGDDGAAQPAIRLERWRASIPAVTSDDPRLSTALRQSGDDLAALQIADPGGHGRHVLAAGAPWFMTLFGRDSLLTAWMALVADAEIARGVLETLARFQGEQDDPRTEEEPGKILHELRVGGADSLTFGDGDVYYGTVDATPLFVMLVGELHRWTSRLDDTVDLVAHADRAIGWMERVMDGEGRGYLVYRRRSRTGLVNQGWKDSWDAIRHADGSLAEAPIALCEVQGYAYAAYIARAHLARDVGDEATADRCTARAKDLRQRFQEDFWSDELGTYAMALDRHGRRVAVAASNAGHLLWTGIVDVDRARSVAARLVDDAGFNGWGVRTLSRASAAYNPVSYHNGSVWPHDNALCAAGLVRYGFVELAHRIIEGQLDAASHFEGRLPELFAGFGRDELSVPAAYPASCSPQAWASAAPLLWLRTLLRLDPCSAQHRFWIAPELPESIRHLHVEGLRIGGRSVSVTVDQRGIEVGGAHPRDVVRSPRAPLTTVLDRA